MSDYDIWFHPTYDDGWRPVPNPSNDAPRNVYNDGWRPIQNPSDNQAAWWEDPILPERKETVSEWNNTLKSLGVENESVLKGLEYIPRTGDWLYENAVRPMSSLSGAGLMGAALSGPVGAVAAGAVGTGMGLYSAYHHLPAFYNNPTYEGGLDLANDALMVLGAGHLAKTAKHGINPYSAMERIAENSRRWNYQAPGEQMSFDLGGETPNIMRPVTPEPAPQQSGFGFSKLLQDESGTIDLGGIWKALRARLGRDPSSAEIHQEAFRQQSERLPLNEGTETGRVAQFDPNDVLYQKIQTIRDPDQIRGIIQNYRKILIEGEQIHSEQAVEDARLILDRAQAQLDTLNSPTGIPVRTPGGLRDEIPPELLPDPDAVPNPEGRGNFGHEAWEETPDDAPRNGPIGIVRRLIDDDSGTMDWGAMKENLRKLFKREPTDEEIRSALEKEKFEEDAGISQSAPDNPLDLHINRILQAYAGNPDLTLIQMRDMIRHLPPDQQQAIMQQVVRITTNQQTNLRREVDTPPAEPIIEAGTPFPNEVKSAQVPRGRPWEENPDELIPFQLPDGKIIKVRSETARDHMTIDFTQVGGEIVEARRIVPGQELPPPEPSVPMIGPREMTPQERLIENKRNELRMYGVNPDGMTHWELDMELQRLESDRHELAMVNEFKDPGQQQELFTRGKDVQQVPESDMIRQRDVLDVARLHEAGMYDKANEIRQLHEMYGNPIRTSEELAALADHYAKVGDIEKAEKYAAEADHWSAKEQGQRELFKPNEIQGGSDDRMSDEWLDILNGKRPPVGPLGVPPSGGLRVPPIDEPAMTPTQKRNMVRQANVEEVIKLEERARQLEKQAEAARDLGDAANSEKYTEMSRETRARARTANQQFAKTWRGRMTEIERFEAMVRRAEAAGDTEAAARLKALVDREYLNEAGQLELRFRKNYLAQKMQELGFELSEKTLEDIDSMDPSKLSHALQKDFADLLFDMLDDGPPGMSIVDATPEGSFRKTTHITIRNEEGRPVAHAEMSHNPITGEGDLENWAVRNDSGMAQQLVLPLAMELEKRGGLVPKGIYSQDTLNFLQRLKKAMEYIKGSRLMTEEKGAVQVPAGGKMWERMKDRAGWGQGYKTTKRQRMYAKQQVQMIDEMLAMSANMTTTGDLSAPGRQGLMLFHTPQFWRAMGAMFRGIGPDGFARIDAELRSLPIFQSGGIDPKTGKQIPSLAQQWGMKLFEPASTPGPHAKAAASNWLETGQFFNKDWGIATRAWKGSPFAMYIRGSNRAYITFLNHLNANRLQYLADRAHKNALEGQRTGRMRKPGILGSLGMTEGIDYNTATKRQIRDWQNYAGSTDPYQNKALGMELADAVNTLTGHAPLRFQALPFRGGEVNLEKHARLFGRLFFAPGLMMSKLRVFNPFTYVMASPQVRKQYLGGLFGLAAGYTAGAAALKAGTAALGYDSEIDLDSNSADFGKIRVGNYRMDPSGGALPYLVLYSRLISGYYTSSATKKTTELGQGFQATTADTLFDRFLSNKQEPVAKFVTDMLSASEHQPVYMKDRILQMMIPLIAQDIWELSQEDPGLIPLSVGSAFGMGSQVYKQGVAGTKFTDPKNESVYAGGGARGFFFGTDFQNQQKQGPQGTPRQLKPRQQGPRQFKPRQLAPRQF